jgi:hypothetical protein
MRTIQGQAAFRQSVRTIRISSQKGQNFFKQIPLDASLQCALNEPSFEFMHPQKNSVNYSAFHNIPAKLSRSA